MRHQQPPSTQLVLVYIVIVINTLMQVQFTLQMSVQQKYKIHQLGVKMVEASLVGRRVAVVVSVVLNPKRQRPTHLQMITGHSTSWLNKQQKNQLLTMHLKLFQKVKFVQSFNQFQQIKALVLKNVELKHYRIYNVTQVMVILAMRHNAPNAFVVQALIIRLIL